MLHFVDQNVTFRVFSAPSSRIFGRPAKRFGILCTTTTLAAPRTGQKSST